MMTMHDFLLKLIICKIAVAMATKSKIFVQILKAHIFFEILNIV
jgi:hypothetical protein